MPEFDQIAVAQDAVEKEKEQDAPTPDYRPVQKSESWKLRKPHPYWRPDISNKTLRLELWLQESESDRLYWSDVLGPRRK